MGGKRKDEEKISSIGGIGKPWPYAPHANKHSLSSSGCRHSGEATTSIANGTLVHTYACVYIYICVCSVYI